MPLDPQAQVVIDMIESMGVGDLTPETDPDEIRALMNAAVLPSGIELASVTDREIPGPGGPIPVRVYRPEGDAPKPVVVYYHGGGWVLGSLDTHDGTCRRLADGADAVVVSVDYRMGPEDRFPAAVDDSYAALRWVAEHAAELGGDPDRLVVAGDSAGGNLAAVVALRAREGGPAFRRDLLRGDSGRGKNAYRADQTGVSGQLPRLRVGEEDGGFIGGALRHDADDAARELARGCNDPGRGAGRQA